MAIIKIKRGPTVPTGLTAGELAFDYTNGNLFIGATGSTISRIAGTSFVSTFNGLSGAVSGVTTTAANTFTALQTFNSGLSAGTGVTFSSNIAVNGGSITTTSTTANVFNTTATILNIGGASTVTTIAGAASGLTLDIANTTHFSGQKNINIATNVSGGGTQRIAIGQGGGSILSSTGGLTLGSSSGSSVTNIIGTSCNITPLTTFSGGISASGGITFNSTIISNGYRYNSSAIELKDASFTISQADNGKIYRVKTGSAKTGIDITLAAGLSVGWTAKVVVEQGFANFLNDTGVFSTGIFGVDGMAQQLDISTQMAEIILMTSNGYFVG